MHGLGVVLGVSPNKVVGCGLDTMPYTDTRAAEGRLRLFIVVRVVLEHANRRSDGFIRDRVILVAFCGERIFCWESGNPAVIYFVVA